MNFFLVFPVSKNSCEWIIFSFYCQNDVLVTCYKIDVKVTWEQRGENKLVLRFCLYPCDNGMNMVILLFLQITINIHNNFYNIVLNIGPTFLLHKFINLNQLPLKVSFLLGISSKGGNQVVILFWNYNIILKLLPLFWAMIILLIFWHDGKHI